MAGAALPKQSRSQFVGFSPTPYCPNVSESEKRVWGWYLGGDPLGGTLGVPTLWGKPTVATNSMAAGKFLAGNFAAAIIGDRMDATIDISEEHADSFVSNKLALRCQERIALAVLHTSAFFVRQFLSSPYLRPAGLRVLLSEVP